MEKHIRTLQEVVDKAEEITDNKDLVAFDRELITAFGLGTVKGTVEQLTVVLQALRTSAMAVTNGILNNLDSMAEETTEEDKEHYYDA